MAETSTAPRFHCATTTPHAAHIWHDNADADIELPRPFACAGVASRSAVITAPGVYELDEDDYHRDPVPGGSLSASGAKLLLPPSCPAKFAWARSHPAKPKRAFDVGHAAHSLLLGVGKPLVEVIGSGKDPNAWATVETKAEVQAVRDAGAVPLHRDDYHAVHEMAQALSEHKDARRLFENGQPEASLFAKVPHRGLLATWVAAGSTGYRTNRTRAA